MDTLAAAFRAGEAIYRGMGAQLYADLCVEAVGDPEVLALAERAHETARPVHLFTCVHYLLMRDPRDPLSRFFPTLSDDPLPSDRAFPDFARYCRQHREELLGLLATRTVQMTYVERCRALLPPLSLVASQAGEPLNLVDVGCSAGVQLTLDHYAYEYEGHPRVGPADAPLTLRGKLRGGPTPAMPRIGSRTGIDLKVLQVRSEEERRWVLACAFPEFRREQEHLAKALDVVARTDMRLLEGDALDWLPTVLAETPSPLCVYHSACLMYWSQEARRALETLLLEASRERDLYRVGVEPSEAFDSWQRGHGEADGRPAGRPKEKGEVRVSRYSGGAVESRVVAYNSRSDYGALDWVG